MKSLGADEKVELDLPSYARKHILKMQEWLIHDLLPKNPT